VAPTFWRCTQIWAADGMHVAVAVGSVAGVTAVVIVTFVTGLLT
jgi:hypothetical protein